MEDAEKLLDSRRFRFCCAAGLLLRARSIRPSTPTCLPDDHDAWMRCILIRARVLQWSTIQASNCWGLHHLLENEFTWPLWPAESHESIKPPPSLPSLVYRDAAMILLLTSNDYRAPSAPKHVLMIQFFHKEGPFYKWLLGDWKNPANKVVVVIYNPSISLRWGCKQLRVRRWQTRGRLRSEHAVRVTELLRFLYWAHIVWSWFLPFLWSHPSWSLNSICHPSSRQHQFRGSNG